MVRYRLSPEMESLHIVLLWLFGIVMIGIGWYVPGAGGIAWLGAATLVFGAIVALRHH